jgi:HK97 family phage portal protein
LGILDRLRKNEVTVSKFQLITDHGNGFFAWNGKIYQSDVVRSAIRPKVRAIGKTVAKHIREGPEGIKVNPEVYMRFLLEEPNPYMTGQMLWEKMATHLELNNNAFAYVNRDENGFPTDIYPITAMATEAIKNASGELFLKFTYANGRTVTFRYSDIIHLRQDFNENEIFGESPAASLVPLMEIINTTDQGIVKAIKNSSVVKWLLKFNSSLRPEDIKSSTKRFVDDYLSLESDSVGAAATDSKMDAKQVEPKDYVPNEKQTANTITRVYAFFNTNEKIIRSEYSENDWISYYESCIEPVVVQMSGEFTRKLFNRRERGYGNRILFESSNLAFASLKTKMDFVNNGIDRGYVNANEGRNVFGLAPIEGGDTYVRRLDTAPVDNKQPANS